MPADFYIDAQRGVVFSKAAGVLNRADVLDHMERLVHHLDFRPEFNQLADFRQTTKVALSSEDVRELSTKAILSTRSQRAFVVSSDLQFGLCRVFGTYRELEGEKGVMIFREMKAALSWLSLSAVPEPKVFAKLSSLTNEA